MTQGRFLEIRPRRFIKLNRYQIKLLKQFRCGGEIEEHLDWRLVDFMYYKLR